MDKSIKEICKRQEIHLRSAVESGYKRATTSTEVNEIVGVYERVFGRKFTENRSCSVCLLKLYRQVGEWFLNEIVKESAGLEPQPKQEVEPIKTQAVKNNKKKNGHK